MQTISEMSVKEFLFYVLAGVIAFVFSFVLVGAALSQETRKPDQFVTKFTITLFTADAVVRSLDGYSTLKNLSNPCRCFHESNPIAPKGSSIAAEAGFQAGAMALSWGTAYLLNKHHHPKAARAVMMFDIGSESYYVGRNFTRREVDKPFGTPIQHVLTKK